MLNHKVFKKYDIRGILSDEFVFELGQRVGSKYGDLVVLTDPKKSSKHFSRVFCEGANSVGSNITHCGVGPTDMCSLAGAHFNKVSVMFTASHLSDDQDGVKFHEPNGLPFSSESIQDIKSIRIINAFKHGSVKELDFFEEYASQAIARYNQLFNHDLSGLKVLVDTKGGCGISHLLLEQLGVNVTTISTKGSDPSFDASLASKAKDYDLVLVHDFDGDRLVVVNEKGIVHGSHVACILSTIYNQIVASIDTSQILSNHANVIYSKVGDPYVARSIVKENAGLGVEPSGHYTDPLFTLSSSGSLFSLILAGLVVEKSINDRLKELPKIKIERSDIKVDDKHSFMNQVLAKASNVISSIDGVKFDFNGGTALVRASGTESLVRFQLENPCNGFSVNDLVGVFQ